MNNLQNLRKNKIYLYNKNDKIKHVAERCTVKQIKTKTSEKKFKKSF